MAEGGEDYDSTSDQDSNDPVFDSSDGESGSDDVTEDSSEDDDVENLSDSDGEEEEFQLEDIDEEQSDEDEEGQSAKEPVQLNEGGRPEELPGIGVDKNEKPHKFPPNLSNVMRLVRKTFYGRGVNTKFVNILTDFSDAKIFLIDGDSLLLEILGEESLDWSNGGQFLHLAYLTERFLQTFTEKGGVFHVVFFKDMEIIWRGNPSMLLAREALILHLQHNTDFTVKTLMVNLWGQKWKDYVDDEVPAFFLLTDAENIPCQDGKLKKTMEFFFRCLLYHCLAHGLNCVFISGIQTTATKVMGFYMDSSAIHKKFFTKHEQRLRRTWQYLMNFRHDQESKSSPRWKDAFPLDDQIDIEAEVYKALQLPPKGGCRQVAAVLGCALILFKALKDSRSTKETMKTVEDRMKLFLLHIAVLNKLPLKYRAHFIDENLLNEFCRTKDGNVYPFNEIHMCLWEILNAVQVVQEYASRNQTGNDFFKSVADLMDGRLVHTLFSVVLQQRSKGVEGLSLPEDVIREVEDAWKKAVNMVNESCGTHSLEAQFFPFAEDVLDFHEGEVSVMRSDADSTMKLRRLTEVQSVLVNDYAGDIRSEINAMAESSSFQIS